MRHITDVVPMRPNFGSSNIESASFLILDNGEVLFDGRSYSLPSDLNKETLIKMIGLQVEAYENHIARLKGVVRKLAFDGFDGVNPVYKDREKKDGICPDCGIIGPLIRSQWEVTIAVPGDEIKKVQSFVCSACESMREYKYGLPPVDADGISGEGLDGD